MNKVPFPRDKRAWPISLIPGPVMLISTNDIEGHPNIAPKSWVQMVSFDPSVLMFSGTKGNTTENNIEQTDCFAVNIVDSSIASKVYTCIRRYGQNRIDQTGFTLSNAQKINAPLVDNCKAHLECKLIKTMEIGSGYLIFGEIIAASIWDKIIQAERDKKYSLLDQIMFLEDSLYGKIEQTYSTDDNKTNG